MGFSHWNWYNTKLTGFFLFYWGQVRLGNRTIGVNLRICFKVLCNLAQPTPLYLL